MLTLRRVEIENFVCFEDLAMEPSTDSARPLTVVRAENGNGKTTLLRAIRWCMYGEKGLPGTSGRYSLHPPWWHPTDAAITTRVSIEFETDGSSRNHPDAGSQTLLYRLDRTVKTIGKPAAADDENDFARVDETSSLMVKDSSGRWERHERHPDVVIGELLPWDLRDFFIMDADKAADFVGGSDENKTLSRRTYQGKTTEAINSLLGLQVFQSAKGRVATIARQYSRKATKAIGDRDLEELEDKLDRAQMDEKRLDTTVKEEKSRKAELADKLEELRTTLEDDLSRLGAFEALSRQRQHNRERRERLALDYDKCQIALASNLESSDLYTQLASVAISATRDFLEPLYEQGRIPLAHLPFVRGLLASGQCVCGQDLSEGQHRYVVVGRVDEAKREAARADYLYHLYQAAETLLGMAQASAWNENRLGHAAELSVLEQELSELKTEQKALNQELDDIDEMKIHTARDHIATVESQLDHCNSSLMRYRIERDDLKKKMIPLQRTIAQRQRNKRVAATHRAGEKMAALIIETLEYAYTNIQDQQVNELSRRMNMLFQQMAANVSDVDFTFNRRSRANLRMIAEVGVRPVDDRQDCFEIYALNRRGRAMPPVEINGASRRVLALSFVLALCEESNTRAPLIADSLLNFMSGAVRRNTLRVTSKHSPQPILLLTGSDLEAPTEIATVTEYAGATYTLTAQWDAIGLGDGGDVINQIANRQVVLLCSCGPREYCRICERSGQASKPGWIRADLQGSTK